MLEHIDNSLFKANYDMYNLVTKLKAKGLKVLRTSIEKIVSDYIH